VSVAERANPVESAADAGSLVRDLERLEEIVALWESPYGTTARAYRNAIDALDGEALRRIVAALRAEPAALAALKRAAEDEVVYAVLRHHGILKPSLQERVETALDGVRPMLATHGGDVQLVRVLPPAAIEIRFTGACEACPASVTTFTLGVKKALEDACPEITDIRQVKGLSSAATPNGARIVSPFASAPGESGETWPFACALADIPQAGVLPASVAGESVLLARIPGGGVACVQNACAHLGLPLDGGFVSDGTIVCPHHGFAYELASGDCLTARGVRLRAHEVRVVGGDVRVRLSP
jgi:nitrite reductase/ring-hydroxylating ferredoxin subunit/Fe-S cluster biogenesis protein NfuA